MQRFSLDLAEKSLLRKFRDTKKLRRNTSIGDVYLYELEFVRLQRAFYRFEVFCNVIAAGQSNPIPWSQEGRSFFDYFAQWEYEQVMCVRQYLTSIVRPGELKLRSTGWVLMYQVLQDINEPRGGTAINKRRNVCKCDFRYPIIIQVFSEP